MSAAKSVVSYITIGTDDLPTAMAFYDAALGALGHVRLWVHGTWAAYGPEGDDHGVILLCAPYNGEPARAGNGIMIGLHAESHAQVDAFYAAAMANGGTCEGPAGPRTDYGVGHYLAYVRDPVGNKLAAFYQPQA
ncbi:VOC family protein [Caulobacter mirabilis]|uniref:VOC family protein n=1 Tax=Caulobacter mirabilis TaxID=69666 RepID=UPI001FE33123|nr:VOC family protein [Caulobacter mirabilis]